MKALCWCAPLLLLAGCGSNPLPPRVTPAIRSACQTTEYGISDSAMQLLLNSMEEASRTVSRGEASYSIFESCANDSQTTAVFNQCIVCGEAVLNEVW